MTIPLWKKIFDAELQNLRSGRYAQGAVFATVDSLSKSRQCSNITARRVLSELAKAGVVKNVPRLGSVVDFRSRFRTRVFLLSPQRMDEPAVSLAVTRCMQSVFVKAAALKIEVTPVNLDDLLKYRGRERAFVIIHYSANRMGAEALLPLLPENLIPVCISAPGKMVRGIAVGCDSGAMTEALFQQLWELGARRIGYFGTTAAPWFLPRFEAYSRCLKEKEIALTSEFLATNRQFLNDEKLLRQFVADNRLDALLAADPKEVPVCTAALRGQGVPVGAFLHAVPEHAECFSVVPDYEKFGGEAVRLITRLDIDSVIVPRFVPLSFSMLEPENLSLTIEEA